jgi:TRIAD3 protein (E3 ubiquitin-protein ligase RNF216)
LRISRIEGDMDALAAFDAARAACEAKAEVRNSHETEERQKEEEEAENMKRAKAEGTFADCGCCYEEKALNRMVHCDGATVHWFCSPCAKQMAEHVVGASKYHLGCMSMDGCDATFSRDQKELFLDDKLTTALELIEQEAVLRMAGIENLATCPFCNYAAEYPPIEENKEFRCEMPDCGLVSCRLCREETHIPKSCDESARERGISARRAIEEAMSAALIRKCNKCKRSTPPPPPSPCPPAFSSDILNRQHALHQGKWLQQNDVHEERVPKCAVLRLLQVVRLYPLQRPIQGRQGRQLPLVR